MYHRLYIYMSPLLDCTALLNPLHNSSFKISPFSPCLSSSASPLSFYTTFALPYIPLFPAFLQVNNQSAASGTEELYDLDVRLSVSLSMNSDSDPSEDTACYTERTSQSPYVSVPTGRFIKMHFFRKEFYAYFPMTLLPLVFL